MALQPASIYGAQLAATLGTATNPASIAAWTQIMSVILNMLKTDMSITVTGLANAVTVGGGTAAVTGSGAVS